MKRVLGCIFAGIALLWLGALYFFDPAQSSSYFLPCLFRLVTGRRCPGCGAQRSIHQLLHGNFLDAILLCPFLYFLMAVVGIYVLCPRIAEKKVFGYSVVTITVVYTVLRLLGIC